MAGDLPVPTTSVSAGAVSSVVASDLAVSFLLTLALVAGPVHSVTEVTEGGWDTLAPPFFDTLEAV